MISISKVLVPTDFSKGSEFAYRYANDLTKKFGGKVDLLHVIPAFRYLKESIRQLGLPFDMDKEVYPHIQKDAKVKLNEAMTTFLDSSVMGKSTTIIERKVDEAITEKSEREKYDLIIIGSQGANENKLLHGSTTEKVIRFSKTPVLTVPPSIPDHPIRKLLIPIDGSDLSFACLPYAISMLDSLGGELTIFHVQEMFGYEVETGTGNMENASVSDTILDKVSAFLNAASINAEIERVPFQLYDHIVVRDGISSRTYKLFVTTVKGVSAHHEIVDYANDYADMIIMTTHGRSGFEHLLLGSTTETVARHSKIPVLTFKPS